MDANEGAAFRSCPITTKTTTPYIMTTSERDQVGCTLAPGVLTYAVYASLGSANQEQHAVPEKTGHGGGGGVMSNE